MVERERVENTYDIVPWVTVQTSAETLLIQEMGNETDTSAEHEQSVEDTHLKVVLGLLRGESTAVAEKVDEADGDTSINVEDQVVLLAGGDGLDGFGIVEHGALGEVLVHVFLDKRDTEIRVVS